MLINIQPIPAFPSTATQLSVTDGQVTLGVGANFQYALLDASGALCAAVGRCALTSDQYNGWTGDDVYIANCVAANLGLTPA